MFYFGYSLDLQKNYKDSKIRKTSYLPFTQLPLMLYITMVYLSQGTNTCKPYTVFTFLQFFSTNALFPSKTTSCSESTDFLPSKKNCRGFPGSLVVKTLSF